MARRGPPSADGRRARPAPNPATASLSAWLEKALAFHRAGNLTDAEDLYRQVLALQPQNFDACHLSGQLHRQAGRNQQAAALLQRAVGINPRHAVAHGNLGNVLMDLGRLDEALSCYDRALRLDPALAEVHNNRGVALAGQGRSDDALASYERALRLKPAYLDARMNQADLLYRRGRLEKALSAYDLGLHRWPAHVALHNNRGNVLRALNRFEEALASYDRALALAPDRAEIVNNRGATLMALNRPDAALASYERAISLDPRFVDAWNNYATSLLDLGRHDDARQAFAVLVRLDADFPLAHSNLFMARQYLCDWSERDALESRITHDLTARNRPMPPFFASVADLSPEQQRHNNQLCVQQKYPASDGPFWRGEIYRHSKIRIAYLSADFRTHATAYLMAHLFELHDRERFEAIAFSFAPDNPQDAMLARLKPLFDPFVDVSGLGDRQVARMMRDREIDIAVDLKGFTGGARPGILSLRPAPIQVNYLGFPSSMGAEWIDYILADTHVIPPDQEAFYTETVVRLPNTYQVNDATRAIADHTPTRTELGLPEQAFVFCCFNDNYKITPTIFSLWMRLLGQVEGSVLWLLEGNATAVKNLRREAEARGISASRLVFAPRLPLADHLARHRRADLFVDTLPCNAHTTASDALWAGLPIVTCTGTTFAGRVAGSLLKAIGMADLIAETLEGYEALALTLARTPSKLAAIKQRLAHDRGICPLFDTDRFRRNLERAYVAMWEHWQRGEPAASFHWTLNEG